MNGWQGVMTLTKAGFAIVLGFWLDLEPLIQLLFIFMALDVISGLMAGFITKKLSRDVSFRGITKKMMELLLVVVAGLLQPHFANGAIPLSQGAALFFIATEGISIVENAAKAGIPIPKALQEALAKLNPEKNGTPPPAPPIP